MTTCPGCGCTEGEPLNDECWPCQTDGEARIGEPMPLGRFERFDHSSLTLGPATEASC